MIIRQFKAPVSFKIRKDQLKYLKRELSDSICLKCKKYPLDIEDLPDLIEAAFIGSRIIIDTTCKKCVDKKD